MKKYDIINALGRRYGLRRYLEICTPTTGHTYAKVDAAWFEKQRLVYNCPETEDDGLDYSYRTEMPYSFELIQTIDRATNSQTHYDLIFVDPFHSLRASATDLSGAWKLLQSGGIMIVHDCNPPDEEMASPEFRPGGWCGVTYQAFIDFVFGRSDLTFYTVDTDYGCGVIRKRPQAGAGRIGAEALEVLRLNWIVARESDETRYDFFSRNRVQLLNLISIEEFEEFGLRSV